MRSTALYTDNISALCCISSRLQSRVYIFTDRRRRNGNNERTETVGSEGQIKLIIFLRYRAGVILNRAILGVLNAQLIAVSNCKASRQFHSYHSCLGDVHRRIVLNYLCIFTIDAQFNAVSRSSSRSYNAVLRSDLQRQRFVCRIIRGRLNLQGGLNVQLLVAGYLGCTVNQIGCLGFVDILDDITRSRAKGRCGNCLSCCCNLFLICLRNLVYLNFRLGNSRLDLNIAGVGLCNYLVAVTGYITGSGNVAACNVCARVGGEVAAGNRHSGTITYFKCTIDFTTHNSSRSPVSQAICTFVKVFDIIVRQANCFLCTRNYTIRDFFNCALRRIFIRTQIPNTQTACCDSATANFANSTPVLDARFICGREYTTANLVYSTLVLKSNKMVLSKRTTRNFVNRTTVAEQGRKMTQSQEFAIRNLRNGRTLSIVDYIPAITISAFAVCAIIYASRKLTTFDFGNSTIIIECCTTMANIINNTTANTIHNCQCTIIGNGMLTSIIRNLAILCSCAVYNLLAIQVESNGLVSRNNNIFNCVFQQSYSIIVSRRNSLSQRLIIGTANLSYRIGFTQLLNSAVILNVTLCNICRNIRGECTAGNFNSIACV